MMNVNLVETACAVNSPALTDVSQCNAAARLAALKPFSPHLCFMYCLIFSALRELFVCNCIAGIVCQLTNVITGWLK